MLAATTLRVFLEVRPIAYGMKPYQARTPRQSPRMANIRNREGEYDKRGSWEDTWHLSLGGILYPGGVLTPGSNRGRLVQHVSGKWVED